MLQLTVDEQIQSIGSKKYLKVHFELTTSRLVKFEQEELGIFDAALLCECEQLIDVDTGRRHDVSVHAESMVPLKVVYLLTDYPNLESTILSHIDDLQQAEIDEYEEGREDGQEYFEPDYEEGQEEKSEYIEPDYDCE